MKNAAACLIFVATLLATALAAAADLQQLTRQVHEAETAFAATMARRDIEAFASYVADDAVFFDDTSALRGRTAIVAAWKSFYEGEQAPFSWKPENVEVLESGELAHSSGPVFDSRGRRVATYNSIWRRNPDGAWKVIFDKGCGACPCAQAASKEQQD